MTLYRLSGPLGEEPTVVQYVGEDAAEALVLGFRYGPRHGLALIPVRLRGLTPGARYRDARTGVVHHANVLGEYGMRLDLAPGDWSSTAVHLVRVPEA